MTDEVPPSLRYADGHYRFERLPGFRLESSPRRRRILSRALQAVHRPWFAVRMPRGVAELTTTGRTSGLPRRTFVRALRDGRRAYLVAIGGSYTLWLKNIVADPRVTLRLADGVHSGVARVLAPDDPAHEAARQAFHTRVHAFDYVETVFHRQCVPSRAKVLELHRAWFAGGTPVVVDLDD